MKGLTENKKVGNGLKNKSLKPVFLNFRLRVKDFSILDLKLGFYVKFPPWNLVPRSGIENLDSKIRSIF